MIDQWYYWRGANVLGPVSGMELAELGASGGILPDDTIWREGFEHGVPASRVKNLFPPSGDSTAVTAKSELALAPVSPAPIRHPRAVAGKGTVLIGQNGTNVRYRMKCTTCGHEDSAVKSMTITRGMIRKIYFCPKCRKGRPTEINVYAS